MSEFVLRIFGLLLLLWLVSVPALSDIASARAPHIEVTLLSEQTALQPGTEQFVAIQMHPDPEWHTYWRNPGDSGEPPKITWSSSHQVTFGDIHWPIPEAIPVAHLVNYGYSDAHLLMVPIHLPATLNYGETVTLSAELSWLVCKEDCIPGEANLSLQLPIANKAKFSAHANLFEQTRAKLPQPENITGELEVNQHSIALRYPAAAGNDWYVFPFRTDIIQHAAKQTQAVESNHLNMVVAKSDYFPADVDSLQFLVSNGEIGYHLVAEPNSGLPAKALHSTPSISTVLLYVGMAFLGGLILNIMPCVLPILSIKAIAIQQQTTPSKLKNAAFLLGVMVCFNAFALLIIALQQGGTQLGWGFHMQSPAVIIALAFLFTFIALLLLDVFSVGSRLAGIGDTLVTGNHAKSHFFTGLLAVVVASPCTAPFMAAALGIAMVSGPATTLIIFNALALGFALPMTLLFISPALRRFIPKPGVWMSTFKQLLAFPMLATVIWLCWVYAGQQGNTAQFALLICLLTFSLLAFLLSKVNGAWTYVVYACMLFTIIAPVMVFTSPLTKQNTDPSVVAFDASKLQALRDNNQVVLVNMTADWCITCKVNEQVALKTADVQTALAAENVHYMVGDWTNKNSQILAYLQQYERIGVPLYVVYAGGQYYEVLPQILTPGLVVDALNKAKQELSHVN